MILLWKSSIQRVIELVDLHERALVVHGWPGEHIAPIRAALEPLGSFLMAVVSIATMGFTGWAAFAAAKAAMAARDGVAAGQKAANAAIEANQINHKSFVLDHRAWIKIERLEIASDMTWTSEGGRVNIRFWLKNTGRSPAKDIFIRAIVSRNLDGHPERAYPIIAKEQLERPPFRNSTIVPGEIDVQEGSLSLPQSEIVAWRKDVEEAFGNPEIPFNPILTVCVTYTLLIDDSRHQTGVICEFYRTSAQPIGGRPTPGGFGPQLGNIPMADLYLSKGLFSDDMAD